MQPRDARPRTRFLIIHNRIAGMRRRWLLRQVCRELATAGAQLSVVPADSLEADRAFAEKAVQSGAWHAVVAAGGDSTVRGVGAGLLDSPVPLGIIPVGTGNVLAHEIGFCSGPRTIAHNLMYGPSMPVQGGEANGACFFAMAGAGFDARVLARLDVGWKRRLGKLAYALPLVGELARRPDTFEAEIDGKTHRCCWLIVAKASRYGGPFRLTRQRTIHGEGFHAVIVRTRSRAALVGVVLALAAGLLEAHPLVNVVRCRQVAIRPQPALLMQLDGEIAGTTPVEIQPSKRSLQLILPAVRG
ncbi:MAG TPA: diacylglycerol kinase family protein [Hyphomicrobiaceae bacterium]|nr:diacylglycerol kinase family protein [Hyphomicrobiaceae bacterium]